MQKSDVNGTRQFSVVATSPALHLSGVHVFLERLFRELNGQQIVCKLVLTNCGNYPRIEQPTSVFRDVLSLPKTKWADIRTRQDLVRQALLQHRPCVYLPNYDFDMGGICATLPDDVVVAGILHSDEPAYYDFYRSYGKYWNHTVAVSQHIHDRAVAMNVARSDRLSVLPYGVEVPERLPSRPGGPLRVAYCGRLAVKQKRIDILADVINACHAEALDIEFSVAGSGQDEQEFRDKVAGAISAGRARLLGTLTNSAVLNLLATSDVMILTSDFEGLPVVLLEAMSRGCVPVVSAIRSGVDELVQDDQNGFLVPVGDVAGYVVRLKRLSTDRELLKSKATASFETIQNGPYSSQRVAASCLEIFERCFSDVEADRYRRPRGRQTIPEYYHLTTRAKSRVSRVFHGLKKFRPAVQQLMA